MNRYCSGGDSLCSWDDDENVDVVVQRLHKIISPGLNPPLLEEEETWEFSSNDDNFWLRNSS